MTDVQASRNRKEFLYKTADSKTPESEESYYHFLKDAVPLSSKKMFLDLLPSGNVN